MQTQHRRPLEKAYRAGEARLLFTHVYVIVRRSKSARLLHDSRPYRVPMSLAVREPQPDRF